MGFLFGGKVVLLAALLQAYFEGSTAQCTVNLTNMVVREGTLNTLFLCNAGKTVKWRYIPSSDPIYGFKDITNYTNTVNSPYNNMFTVSNTGLTILNATGIPVSPNYPYSTSGLHVVEYSNTRQTGAQFVVVRQGPICTCIPINQTNAQMSSSITFYEYMAMGAMYPIFTWIWNGQVVFTEKPAPTQLDAFTWSSTSAITADDTLTCEVNFSTPATNPNPWLAKNAPFFNESCIATSCLITTTAKMRTNTWSQTTTSILQTSTTSSDYPTKETGAETIEITTKTTTTSSTPSCKLSQIFIYTVITDVNPTAANGYCDWADPVDCPYDVRICRDCRDNYELCSNSTELCEEMCRVKTGNNNTRGHCVDNYYESGCPCLFKGFKACFCS